MSFPTKSLLLFPSASSRYFAPRGQKQWLSPGDGVSTSCSKLSCPQASQMQAFTHPAQLVPVSPPSIAVSVPDSYCTEQFQEQRPPEATCPALSPLSGTSNSVAQRGPHIMLRPVTQPLRHITAPLELISSSFSCLFSSPFTLRYPRKPTSKYRNQHFSRPFVPADLTFYGAAFRKAYANYIAAALPLK